MGKRPFPDPEQAPPQTAQKKPDDSGRTCSYQQNETIIRIKYSRSKRFEPSSYPFPSIRQELLPRGLPTSRKSLEGERRGGRGEGTFLQKGSLSPPPIFSYPTLIHIDDGNLAGFGVQHVHGTPQSRVKGADKPRYVDGFSMSGTGTPMRASSRAPRIPVSLRGAQFQRVADTI